MIRRFCCKPLLALALAFGLPLAARSPAHGTTSAVRLDPLTVVASHGRVHFRVEVARTDAEQERGLMFRDSIAPDRGMIFPFARPWSAVFWMKNTRIPLDIIFIRADGTIARIAAMATPYSLDMIPSGEPVVAALEIAGGRAAATGIAPGDRVRWDGLGEGGR